MPRRYGSGNASSLFKSAQAAQERQVAYDDDIAAFEWNLSAKTPEDFAKYNSYLQSRAAKVTDPAKALSMQRTMTTAYRTFNSAQIFRASTEVKYGAIGNRDKYGQMLNLFEQAMANGDMQLAQSIEGQLASLSVTIQNEEQAAADRASAAGARAEREAIAAYRKGVSKTMRDLETGLNQIEEGFRTGKPILWDGKQIYVNDRNLADLKGQALQIKAQVLQQVVDDGMDETGTYLQQLTEVQSKPEFIRATNGLQGGMLANGVSPTGIEFDAFGVRKPIEGGVPVDKNKIIGRTDDGRPIYAPKEGIDGDNFFTNIQIDDKATNPNEISTFKFKLETDKEGNKYYDDMREGKGKRIYVSEYKDKNGETQFLRSLEPRLANPAAMSAAESLGYAYGPSIGRAFGGATKQIGGMLDIAGAQRRKDEQLRLEQEAKARREAEALESARLASEQAAIARQRLALPNAPAPIFNPRSGTYQNVRGPVAPTPEDRKATNTIGTPEFASRYGLPGPTPPKPTPTPPKQPSVFDRLRRIFRF